jgi:hypothetical protein
MCRADRHTTKCYSASAGQIARIPLGRGADAVPAAMTCLDRTAILASGVPLATNLQGDSMSTE